MFKDIKILSPNINYLFKSIQPRKFHLNFLLLSGLLLVPLQQTRSEEIFLKCVGKYEINRGALIKPDWETSYLTINLDGLISTIDDKGIKKEGRTLIRRNSYTITYRDNKRKMEIFEFEGVQ